MKRFLTCLILSLALVACSDDDNGSSPLQLKPASCGNHEASWLCHSGAWERVTDCPDHCSPREPKARCDDGGVVVCPCDGDHCSADS